MMLAIVLPWFETMHSESIIFEFSVKLPYPRSREEKWKMIFLGNWRLDTSFTASASSSFIMETQEYLKQDF